MDYSVAELVEDNEFVLLVKHPEKTEEWEQFLSEHPGCRKEIIQARKIILLFETSEGVLSDEKKSKLWKGISRFNKEFSHHTRIIRMNLFIRGAAAILIIAVLGGFWYWNVDRDSRQFQFSGLQDSQGTQHPLLVLSDGSRVDLGEKESKITVLKDQEAIQVNDDSIISNTSANGRSEKMTMNEVIIPFGKKSSMVLADGTKVWLNAGSRFAFPTGFEGKKRQVFLEGEGYFEVKKNAEQPFVIYTNDIEIEVLGTKFDVSAYPSNDFVETVLLDGRVQISKKEGLFGEKVVIAPNQKVTYSKTRKDLTLKKEPNPSAYMAWIEGWYPFSNETPEQVLKKLERYYNIRFEYDPELLSSSLPVSGKLDLKDSLSEVLSIVSKVSKIDYQIKGDRVILSGKQKNE